MLLPKAIGNEIKISQEGDTSLWVIGQGGPQKSHRVARFLSVWYKLMSTEKLLPTEGPRGNIVRACFYINDWYRKVQPTVGGTTSGPVVLAWIQSRMSKPWKASQQAVLPDSCLELLPWLLFTVKCKMYAEISPFLPNLPVVMGFITTLESKLWHQVSTHPWAGNPVFFGFLFNLFLQTKMTALSHSKNHSTAEKWPIRWLLTFVLLDFSGSLRRHLSVLVQELACEQ